MRRTPLVICALLNVGAVLSAASGVVGAAVYYHQLRQAVSGLPAELKGLEGLPVEIASYVAVGGILTCLLLAALAQITRATAESAEQARIQADLLTRIADAAKAPANGSPSVDDTARAVAAQIQGNRPR